MPDVFRPLIRTVEDRVAHRREQLRKAQKTFRERRDQYLRLLEEKVQHLQRVETQLQGQVDRLNHQLAVVKQELEQTRSKPNGITQYSGTPSLPDIYDDVPAQSTVIWIESRNDQPYQMHVRQVPQPGSYEWPISPASTGPDFISPPSQDSPGAAQTGIGDSWYDHHGHESSPLSQASVLESGHTLVSQLDIVVVAMEFVLKLERPCLPHIHQGDEKKRDPPDGHVHTATAAMLCTSRSSDCSPLPPSWNAPTEILRRLLDMSTNLPVEGVEATPVLIWHRISRHPCFAYLNIGQLAAMSDRLLVHIKCYGFGAVVKQDHVKKVISEVLG